jgi:protein-disulfide isomerase
MTSKATLPLAGRDHTQGRIDAPTALVEYGDFQCPYCAEAHSVVKAIQERLGERLCFAYRHFPLANMHPYAEHAAEAAEAAGAQGRFWEMHDVLFENQNALDDESLQEYAESIGLDVKRFMEEMANGAHADRVKEDFRGGVRNGVNGTPTFFINGERYDGELDAASLFAALSESGA